MKKGNAADLHIGQRIRMRRLALGMSQDALSRPLGLTFQQVQRYENGTNGVRGSRMIEIARALEVAPGFFFEGLDGATPRPAKAGNIVERFFTLPHAADLAESFVQIETMEDRAAIIDVAGAIAAKYPLARRAKAAA